LFARGKDGAFRVYDGKFEDDVMEGEGAQSRLP
jgi:hypothetical protein